MVNNINFCISQLFSADGFSSNTTHHTAINTTHHTAISTTHHTAIYNPYVTLFTYLPHTTPQHLATAQVQQPTTTATTNKHPFNTVHTVQTVHTATGNCQTDTAVCLLACREQYLFGCCMYSLELLMMGRKDRPKHVECHSKIK